MTTASSQNNKIFPIALTALTRLASHSSPPQVHFISMTYLQGQLGHRIQCHPQQSLSQRLWLLDPSRRQRITPCRPEKRRQGRNKFYLRHLYAGADAWAA